MTAFVIIYFSAYSCIVYINEPLRRLAARFTNAQRSPKTPFGRLVCIINFSSIKILINNVYGTIDNKK